MFASYLDDDYESKYPYDTLDTSNRKEYVLSWREFSPVYMLDSRKHGSF